MDSFFRAVSSVAIILLLTATGYLCAARHWVGPEIKSFISEFLMTIAIPCMTVRSFCANLTREMIEDSWKLLLIPMVCIGLNYVISHLLGKTLRLPREKMGVFMLMCSMSNTMFIGYAMCTEIFGEVSVPYIMLFYLVSTSYTQLVGVPLVRKYGTAEVEKKENVVLMFFKTPAILAIFLGFLLVMCNVTLPSLVDSYCKYMSNIVTPLALLMTGYIIYEIGLKSLQMDLTMWVVLLFRFLFSPLMFLAVGHLLGIDGLARSVFVVEAAMPVITLSVVAAVEYGGDDRFAAQGAAISTLASFLVIPAYMLVL